MGRRSDQPKRERVVLSTSGERENAQQRDRRVEAVRRSTAENDRATVERWEPRG